LAAAAAAAAAAYNASPDAMGRTAGHGVRGAHTGSRAEEGGVPRAERRRAATAPEHGHSPQVRVRLRVRVRVRVRVRARMGVRFSLRVSLIEP